MDKKRLLAGAAKPVAALGVPLLDTAAVTLSWAGEAGATRLPTDRLKRAAEGAATWSTSQHTKMASWSKLNRKWVIGLAVGVTAIIIFFFFYDWIWLSTTNEQWTLIMRRNWWYLVVPAAIALSTTTYLFQATVDDVLQPGSPLARPLRQAVVWRVVVLVILTMVIGVLCGHVFWSSGSS